MVNKAREYVERGDALVSDQPETAIALYDKAIETDPSYIGSYYSKAKALSILCQDEAAIIVCDKAIQLDSSSALAYYLKGSALKNLGQNEAALIAFDKAIERDSSYADAHNRKGSTLLALSQNQNAIRAFDKAIELNPKEMSYYFNKAHALSDLDQKEAAIAVYDRIIELDPSCVVAYQNKALALSGLGRDEDAIATYDKVTQLDPNNVAAYYSKGLVLSDLGRNQSEIVAFDKAIELDPNEPAFYSNKAIALSNLGQNEAALTVFEKVIEADPSSADSYNTKASFLIALGQWETVITICDKTIQLDPKNAHAYHNKGLALFNLGQNEAAIGAYDKAIALDSNEPNFYANKAIVLASLDQNEAAIALCNKAIQIDVTCANYHNIKGECLVEMGNLKEAIKCYEQAIRLDDSHDLAYANKGFALYNLGEIEEAIKFYDKQLERISDSWELYAKKGKALYDQKKTPEALELFGKALDLIDKGKLEGNRFTSMKGSSKILNTLEIKLMIIIKELMGIPNLEATEKDSEEWKAEIKNLNQKKDDLKFKVLLAVISVTTKARQDEIDDVNRQVEELKLLFLQANRDMSDSGITDLAEVKRGFKELETQDPKLLAYCKTFYWTSINLFGAYRMISSGLLTINFEAENTKADNILSTATNKATGVAAEMPQGVPILGRVLGMLDTVINNIEGSFREDKVNNKVIAINKVIQSKLGTQDDISLNVAKAALAITRVKKQAILNPETISSNKQRAKTGLEWVADQISAIQDRILPSIQLPNEGSHAATLALQDVILFMAYIAKNSDSMIKSNETLDKQLENIIMSDGLDRLLEDMNIGVRDSLEARRCCSLQDVWKWITGHKTL